MDDFTRSELEALVTKGWIREFAGVLRNQVPGASPQQVADAIQTSVSGLLARTSDEPIVKLDGYLFRSARNALVKQLQPDAIRLVTTDPVDLPERPDPGQPPGRRIEVAEIMRLLGSLVEAWESERMRVVTGLYLDGIEQGEELTAAEVRDLVAATTGDELTDANVAQLKLRGFARLKRDIQQTISDGGDDPFEGVRP